MLKPEDIKYLLNSESKFIHYLPVTSKESQFINEQTIVANRLQSDRNSAQQELADWIRFSTKDAEKYRDGLTTASMEIEGFSGWVVRNFYSKDNVMKKDFRETGLDKIKQEVSESAGWILITNEVNLYNYFRNHSYHHYLSNSKLTTIGKHHVDEMDCNDWCFNHSLPRTCCDLW
ncbi:hypothetical protein [Nostoc sp.]|uniref:hypothetical protein n=1 Tax=Nostoc sp. TaxID=1180 RepID=UPI002FF4761E